MESTIERVSVRNYDTESPAEIITHMLTPDAKNKLIVVLAPHEMLPENTLQQIAGNRAHWFTLSDLHDYHHNFDVWKWENKKALHEVHSIMDYMPIDYELIIYCLDPALLHGIILTYLFINFNYDFRATEDFYIDFLQRKRNMNTYSLPLDFKQYIIWDYISDESYESLNIPPSTSRYVSPSNSLSSLDAPLASSTPSDLAYSSLDTTAPLSDWD